MGQQQSTDLHKRIGKLLADHRLYDAFAVLKQAVSDADAWNLADELSAIETSYKYMLQYFIAGSDDDRREVIRAEIIESLYSLTDRLTALTMGNT